MDSNEFINQSMNLAIKHLVNQPTYHIRLEQSSQHGAKHLEAKQGSLSMALGLLVLDGIGQSRHDVQLLER